MSDSFPYICVCPECKTRGECKQVGKLQWRVICPECGECGETRNNAIDAIQNWNDPASLKEDREVDDNGCPNGCGQLRRNSPNFDKCPVCQFERLILSRTAR